jgi:hypothetical protein
VLKASASFEPFELGLSVVTEDKVGRAFQELFRAEAQLLRSPVEPRRVSNRDAGRYHFAAVHESAIGTIS